MTRASHPGRYAPRGTPAGADHWLCACRTDWKHPRTVKQCPRCKRWQPERRRW